MNTSLVFGIGLALLVPVTGTLITDAPGIWPVSTLIYNLGLLGSFALMPTGRVRATAYAILAAILSVIESSFFLSYYLQNTGFNEAFFYHIRPDLLHAGVREHLPLLLGMIVCLFGFLAISSSVLFRKKAMGALSTTLALGLLTLGLLISPPVKDLAYHFYNLSSGAKSDDVLFEDFRELLNQEVTVEFSKSKKRPNIVMIYAESLEQRFFDETLFPDLVPNLKRIKGRSIDFSNVSQGVGAGWTIGGIVASQCGYPLAGYRGIDGNEFSIFNEFLPRAVCLGDLLEKDGYHLTFIGGADARFAGKGDFLGSHGYSELLDRDDLLESLIDRSYLNSWGIFDDTLFDSAIEKFISLSRNKSPFMLTLLTLDNHGPVGYLR